MFAAFERRTQDSPPSNRKTVPKPNKIPFIKDLSQKTTKRQLRFKNYPSSAPYRNLNNQKFSKFEDSEENFSFSSKKLEKELREINQQLEAEEINNTFTEGCKKHRKYTPVKADQLPPFVNKLQKLPEHPKNEIEHLNQLCSSLLKEQNKLKKQIEDQENVIRKLKSHRPQSQAQNRNEPLRLFQKPLKPQIKPIESSLRSLTPGRKGTNKENFSPLLKPNSKRDLSLPIKSAGCEDSQELITFRPSQSRSPKARRFPREVFKRQVARPKMNFLS